MDTKLLREIKKLPNNAYPLFLLELGDKELSTIAHAKRFVQRYKADQKFRELVNQDPRKAVQDYNIRIDPEDIRPLWDIETGRKLVEQGISMTPATELCLRFDKEVMVDWSMRHRSGQYFSNPNVKTWWERQVMRSASEIGPAINANIVHAPVCFELCSGCTVGCWFCGLSAERFKSAFAYTPDNQILWREVLEVIRDTIGPAAQAGFCYWATEPLDNPDYEKFITDYHAIIGSLPSTTTATASKDMPRTRSLLQLWKEHGFVANHLSVLTVKQLDRIHEEFTAEDLVFTGMKFVNKESTTKKARAGRALEKINIQNNKTGEEEPDEAQLELTQGTIACVTGFLINMVEKTAKLITPCKASAQWPKGYKIIDEAPFINAEDLKLAMERMIADRMPLTLTGSNKVRLRESLRYEPATNGFRLSTEFLSHNIDNAYYGRMLGDLIHSGSNTVNQIIEATQPLGATREAIIHAIDALFKNGLLEE